LHVVHFIIESFCKDSRAITRALVICALDLYA